MGKITEKGRDSFASEAFPLPDDSRPPQYHVAEDEAATQWSSQQWAEAILEKASIQASENKLQSRLNEFLLHASPAEMEAYEKSRTNLLRVIESSRETYEKAYGGTKNPEKETEFIKIFKKNCQEAAEIAFQYTKILDPMVQAAPPFAALAYGAVKILIYAQVNSQELKANILKYMDRIRATFDMVDHLTVYLPSANLVAAMTQLYGLFHRFLAKAIRMYTRSRLKMYLSGFAKPWRKLESIVDSIEFTYSKVKDITQFHAAINTSTSLSIGRENLSTSRNLVALTEDTLAVIRQLSEQVEALSVKMSKENDVHEIAALLHQRVEEKLDNPALDDTDSPLVSSEDNSDEANLDQLLQTVFTDLREFDEANNQRREVIEELPEMADYRTKKRNLLRAQNIMDWIESEKSRLLWIDGSKVLSRSDFNSLFAAPLLILGENTFESILILRHFCGDGVAVKTNNYRTLVQSLIFQVFKQRPRLLKKKFEMLGREQSNNLLQLWNVFLECLEEASADCIFIIIDSIDYLGEGEVRNSVSERQIVLRQLEALVNDAKKLVKILLTASIAHSTQGSADTGHAALTIPFTPKSPTSRQLSLSIMQNETSLLPQKLIDIQERTSRTITFSQLPTLYPLNSVIYTKDTDADNQYRAYIVSELSGMEHRAFNMYAPLRIRAWSVQHNGRYFTKRYSEFLVSQFPGEKSIRNLKFVPTGYLPNEAELRKELIARGRKYWELGNGIFHKQVVKREDSVRIIVDLQSVPTSEETPLQEIEDQFPIMKDSKILKPRILLACAPALSVYNLRDGSWDSVSVNDIEDITFQENTFDRLYLPKQSEKTMMLNLVKSCTTHQDQRLLTDKDTNTSHDDRIILLFHGEPGTGKTFAATCIAETAHRPLLTTVYTSNTASLGDKDFERFLSHQFYLAQRWGAIMLLENAEQFLGKTSPENASVTLRLMDRFTGVLILCTNKKLDAVNTGMQSRLTQHFLFYRMAGDLKAQLWTQLFRGIGMEQADLDELIEFVNDHNFSSATATGRDIQNSFMAAKRIAGLAGEPLGKQHLESVLAPRQSYIVYV